MLPILLLGGAVIFGVLASGCNSPQQEAEKKPEKSQPPPSFNTPEPSTPAPSASNYIEVTASSLEKAGGGPCAHWAYGDNFIEQLKKDGRLGKSFDCDQNPKYWSFDMKEIPFKLGKPEIQDLDRLKLALANSPRGDDQSIDYSVSGLQKELRNIFDSKNSMQFLESLQRAALEIKASGKNYTVLSHTLDIPVEGLEGFGINNSALTAKGLKMTPLRAQVVAELLISMGANRDQISTAGAFHLPLFKEELPQQLHSKLLDQTRWVAILPRD